MEQEIKIGNIVLVRRLNGEFWVIKNSVQSVQLMKEEVEALEQVLENLLIESLEAK